MKLIERAMRKFGYAKIQTRSGNLFNAAAVNRLTNDWSINTLSPDAAIWKDLRSLRSRARDLERNNDYVRKFLSDLEKNILGSFGIGLQMKIKDPNGSYDRVANDLIETAWKDFCKRGTFTVTRKMSALTACRLIVRSIARDGECLIRKVRGFENGWGFSIQLIESDLLDIDYNSFPMGGNKIKMGVELNQWDEPVAYHILPAHPGDLFTGSTEIYKNRVRVPAEEILHPFIPERIGQTRGYPWLASSMLRLQMLGAWEESALVAARNGASTMGFFERTTPEGWSGEDDGRGNLIQEVEPGLLQDLPMGVTFKPHNAAYPNIESSAFRKDILRGIASGLCVSYNNLAGDYESVNYSSLRAAALDDREVWKMIQTFFCDEVMAGIFEPWLEMALMSGKVALPLRKLDKFTAPEWKPRRWSWVDPLKDVQASILEVDNGFTSRRQIIAEDGGDIEDTFNEISEDEALEEEYGIELGVNKQAVADAAVATAKEEAKVPPGKD